MINYDELELRDPVTVLNKKKESTEDTMIEPSRDGEMYISRFNSVLTSFNDNEDRLMGKDIKPTKRKTPSQTKTANVLPTTIKRSDVIKTDGKTPKSKKKEDESIPERERDEFFETRFEKPLSLVNDIIIEFDDKKNAIEAEIDELRKRGGQRGGAILEYIGKQDSNIISLLNNKLSAVKEVTNIYSKISDLELKKSKVNKDAGGNENTSATVSKVYERMMSDTQPFSLNDLYDTGQLKESYSYEDTVDSALDRRYNNALRTGDITENQAEANLKYSDIPVEIRVIRSEESDNWRFIAVNTLSEEEIFDYSLPSVVGTMRFNLDNMTARDNLRVYPLLLVPAGYDIVNTSEFITDFTSKDDDSENDQFCGYHRF